MGINLPGELSGAKTVTLSFWVRSSKTGVYTVGMKNAGATSVQDKKNILLVLLIHGKKRQLL